MDFEHRLLLHAAGELPPRDAAELEATLKTDATARGRLEDARLLLAASASHLSDLDAANPPRAGAVARAARGAGEAVGRALDARDARRAASSQTAAPRLPAQYGRVWHYARWPLAAAAAMVVGLISWTLLSEPTAMAPIASTGPTGPTGGGSEPILMRPDLPVWPRQTSRIGGGEGLATLFDPVAPDLFDADADANLSPAPLGFEADYDAQLLALRELADEPWAELE